MNLLEPAKIGVDIGAGGITLLSLFNIIPKVTALLSLVWVVIRLYETDTIQKAISYIKSLKR